MKDYSQFIPSPYGFITKYEIKDGKIYVYVSKSNKPNIYPATKESIEYFDSRLETQYKLIIENKKIIEEYLVNKRMNKITPIILTIVAILTILTFTTGLTGILPWAITAFIATGSIISIIGIHKNQIKKCKQEMNSIEIYLKNREDIENKSQEDHNITKYLSKKTQKILEYNEKLMESNLIDNVFNIDFLDKLLSESDVKGLKDLKEILLRYQISKDIKKEQQFLVQQTKTNKTKKKTKKSNQK